VGKAKLKVQNERDGGMTAQKSSRRGRIKING